MGLLDEAIKEHLDLKRRRGADPEDVAREEREALGPAVREVRESMSDDAPSAEAGAPGADGTPEPAPAAAVAPVTEEPVHEAQEPPAAEEPAPPAPEDGESSTDQATQVFDAEDLFAEENAPVPDPEAPATDEGRPAPADPDAVRPDPEAPSPPAEGAAPAQEGEDVLEETPDFLQETPEHDRLWFEQKPPRDFDFDK
jgi:hypothetical protein